MQEGFYVLSDYLTNGFKTEFLDILSLIAIFFGATVIVIKNPIGSLMCLIGLFGTISIYLIIIGLNFIGLSYLIVYIGAVSILFLFILMLINIRSSELLSNNINSIPLALIIIILLNYSWISLSPEYSGIIENTEITNLVYSNLLVDIGNFYQSKISNIMFVTSNSWDGSLVETSHITTVGMVLYTAFNMWLWIASLILVLAMVGSIIITITVSNVK
jgi:NADH-ubiquinone oxidoreductase chain 6